MKTICTWCNGTGERPPSDADRIKQFGIECPSCRGAKFVHASLYSVDVDKVDQSIISPEAMDLASELVSRFSNINPGNEECAMTIEVAWYIEVTMRPEKAPEII